MARILVTDDEAGIREFLSDVLELDGHTVDQAESGEKAIASLKSQSYALVMTDLNMPGISGMELLQWVKQEQPEVEVIVLTAHGTVGTAVDAMKLGAFEFLQKPVSGPDEIQVLARRALERRELRDRVDSSKSGLRNSPRLSYGAPAMQPVAEAIRKVANTTASVLLLGESGSGKEIAARSIHDQSDRRDKPFMAINCAALTETLLESELFGHEKGAFTGADKRSRGRIEYAEGGSFFLDEIGELQLNLQAKLLRVLQEKRFERVGGTQSIDADVRWIAATNRDLRSMMERGLFREDLYHRLAVFPIQLPPLRERHEDIAPLAKLLLANIAQELGRPGLLLSDEALKILLSYTWPGNIRELKNTLERAAILADDLQITASDIRLDSLSAPTASVSLSSVAPSDTIKPLAELERDAIANALRAVDGNRRKAATLLGIGERTLYDKIKRYGL
ncbi:MAG: sigma-54-dependent Fis family transcriptional regulator [Kofleriaceae bacterium]|nr:sigma-54-dependent Fis family transcriptional regulator [Kofleriaceae bacterium]